MAYFTYIDFDDATAKSQLYLRDQMKYLNEHDTLTGLNNRTKYMDETRKMLDEHPGERFAMVCFNINHFRTFNSFWGEQGGNQVLQYTADKLRVLSKEVAYCTYGRIESDIFLMCEPYDEKRIRRQMEFANREIGSYKQDYILEISLGVFVIDDNSMDVEEMYSRAALAVAACKKEYTHLCYYKPQMSESVQIEQHIINEMHQALDEGQFIFYLQPKYDLKTNQPCGAEALVRWQHPTQGIISPGVFIPVFERNGFIGKVDYYIWEQVCKLLRKWLDEGNNPAPISVNVSRVNLYNPNLVKNIVSLAEKYKIPPKLLNLEITESAYMENPNVMCDVVKALHEKGFVVMMDDFGSGYSSLNTLKNIPIDVLKIDMKFLSTDENDSRGARILASVIRMADWLSLPIVVEGVETARQKDFLLGIGCGFVQGYFFARPMPVAKYEEFVRNVPQHSTTEMPENIDDIANTLWTTDPQVELLFKSINQPIAVFEYNGENFRPLRVNQQYSSVFEYDSAVPDMNAVYLSHFMPETMGKFRTTFNNAIRNNGTASCDYQHIDSDGTQRWFHVDIQYWGYVKSDAILFALFRDITDQKKFEHLREYLCNRPLDTSRKKLLIVEETSLGRELQRHTFEPDFEIIEADNGETGIEMLRKYSGEIAVILLDMNMPVIDGREFLRLKNENADFRDIPVVVISADNDSNEQLHMLSMGINDYVTNPFLPDMMRRRVENALAYSDRFSMLVREYRNDTEKSVK